MSLDLLVHDIAPIMPHKVQGRDGEARAEFERAAGLTQNACVRAVLEARAARHST